MRAFSASSTGAYLPFRKSITPEMVWRYSSSEISPAQGAGHWPTWWCTQGRSGFSGLSAFLHTRMGNTIRTTSSTSRTTVAPW